MLSFVCSHCMQFAADVKQNLQVFFPPPGAGHPTPRKNQSEHHQRTEKEQADHQQSATKKERGVIEPFWDTFIHICKAVVLRSNSTKIQKLYLAKNHIKRYNKSTRRLQPSGA